MYLRRIPPLALCTGLCALALSSFLTAKAEAADPAAKVPTVSGTYAPKTITGIRTWKRADGKTARMRVNAVAGNTVFCNVAGSSKDSKAQVSDFAAEHQDLLKQLRSGAVKVDMYPLNYQTKHATPLGKPPFRAGLTLEKANDILTSTWVGAERTWTRKDGKQITGALVNITDDELGILIGGVSYAIAVDTLDDASRQYVEHVLTRKEPTFFYRENWARDEFPGGGGGSARRMTYFVPFTRTVDAYKDPVKFETAVEVAREHMEAHFGDLRHWELDGVYEHGQWTSPSEELRPSSMKDRETCPPLGWVFTFVTTDAKSMEDARRKLPYFFGESAPRGYVSLPIFADGKVSDYGAQK